MRFNLNPRPPRPPKKGASEAERADWAALCASYGAAVTPDRPASSTHRHEPTVPVPPSSARPSKRPPDLTTPGRRYQRRDPGAARPNRPDHLPQQGDRPAMRLPPLPRRRRPILPSRVRALWPLPLIALALVLTAPAVTLELSYPAAAVAQ